ncbi:unnamed protein product [Cuscuta epithymum]|uniref:Protein kinase domain-containing protein n=1 Tax=Cuscuta epithymum TaxID=186058 RepID=A0AAV0F5D8_9ASTE|nr:unnamed protein product [Cuscuta epithymum]
MSSGNCSSRPCLYQGPVEWVKGKAVGCGSHGNIHLALNKSTGSLFVIKSAESKLGIQCLENEAQILESLDSPHIVKCLGKEVSKGTRELNLFMEYMAGGSLADVMDQFGGKFDETVIRLYTREILFGLKYLHGNGIVHCDLKCKNILLGSSGELKLADFGLSQRTTRDSLRFPPFLGGRESLCFPRFFGGSPLWMAPETLRNEGIFCASDIWSLGCTVIEMATGQLPWAGKISNNPTAALLRIACSEDRPNFPTHFSKEGLDFLEKCLDRDPRRRWKAEELLHHPFVSPKSKVNVECTSSPYSSSSPASVLDKSVFPEDEDEPSPHVKIPFSILCEKIKFEEEEQQSEDWITVR